MRDRSSPEKILQLGMSFWGSKALLSAIEHVRPLTKDQEKAA